MFNEQYIVTVIHKNTLIQHLVRGSLMEACRLAVGFRMGPFRGGLVEGSVLEITKNNVSIYNSNGTRSGVANYNINNDLYVIQEYEIDGSRYCVHGKYTESRTELNEFIKNDYPKRNHCIINKINFREITRIDINGNETKVMPMDHIYLQNTKTVEFDYEPIKVRI